MGLRTIESYVAEPTLRWLRQVARMAESSLPKKLLTGWYHSDTSRGAGKKIRVVDSYGQCVRNTCFSFVLDNPKLTKEAERELKCMPTAMFHDKFRSWFTLATLGSQVWRTEVVLATR